MIHFVTKKKMMRNCSIFNAFTCSIINTVLKTVQKRIKFESFENQNQKPLLQRHLGSNGKFISHVQPSFA